MMILQIMEIELIALDRPISDFISPVNAGTAEPMGLNTNYRCRRTKAQVMSAQIKTDPMLYQKSYL